VNPVTVFFRRLAHAPRVGIAAGILASLTLACATPKRAPLDLPQVDAESGRLLIFVQADESPIARGFQHDELPAILELAREMGSVPSVVDVASGAPPEVTLTPLLVFQNHRGRSTYEGRSASLGRLRTFLRTARRAPLGDAGLERRDVLVWHRGRTLVTSPVKIGDVTGTQPPGYDSAGFQSQARADIARGASRFTRTSSVLTGRGDRAFYMDFYPWCADDGTLYLSTALYSQFHCKQPVYRTPADAPFVGPWCQRERIFREAAADLQRQVLAQIEGSELGDGFDVVSRSTPVISWTDLGLDLPPAPVSARHAPPLGPVPTSWVLGADTTGTTSGTDAESMASAEPTLLFHFPAPLDSYRGEVTGATGSLRFEAREAAYADPTAKPTGSLVGRGEVVIAATDVSMGDADIDAFIHGPGVLDASRHPQARFELEALTLDDGAPLAWGRLAFVTGRGRFWMAGASIPLSVRAELEAILDERGRSQLLVTGSFEVPLTQPFAISVPVGDPPANQRVVFDFAFALEARSEERPGKLATSPGAESSIRR
jgi:hypothetical protein